MSDTSSSGAAFPEEIDLLPANSKLDAILAERVLGASVRRHKEWTGYENWIATTPEGETLYIMVSPHGIFTWEPLWTPSTDHSQALALVQHLFQHSEYRSITEQVTEDNGYSATLWPQQPVDHEATEARPGDGPQPMEPYSVTGTGPTPALAVCRAVYKAASRMRPPQMDADGKEKPSGDE
jgi:hypothetical protein